MTGYGKEKELDYQDLLDQNHIKYAYQIKYELFSFNNKINKICDFILYIDEKRYCIEIKNQTTSGSVFEKIGGFTDYFICDSHSKHNDMPFDEILIVVSGSELVDGNDDMLISKNIYPFANAINNKNLILPIDIITEEAFYKKFNIVKKTPIPSINQILDNYMKKLKLQNKKKQLELNFE